MHCTRISNFERAVNEGGLGMLPHGTKMMNLVPSIVYRNYDEKASVKGLWGFAEVLIGLEGQQTASSDNDKLSTPSLG